MGTREHPCDQVFSKRQQQKTARKCVTMRLQLWSWTTGPACARLDLPETMPQGPSSPPSLAVPVTRVSWLAWDRRTPTSVTRPSPTLQRNRKLIGLMNNIVYFNYYN